MNKAIITILFLCAMFNSHAQIGYQVSLLDAATGQPRADETVSVRIDLTDNSGTTICSETKSATSDEFGVLSLTIGNASTFNDVDWSKLPFFISATVDGILLGKSQVLSVPVAEHAKHTGTLSKKILMGRTWTAKYQDESTTSWSLSFSNSTVTLTQSDPWGGKTYSFKYIIAGDMVICHGNNNHRGLHLYYTDSCLSGPEYPDFN